MLVCGNDIAVQLLAYNIYVVDRTSCKACIAPEISIVLLSSAVQHVTETWSRDVYLFWVASSSKASFFRIASIRQARNQLSCGRIPVHQGGYFTRFVSTISVFVDFTKVVKAEGVVSLRTFPRIKLTCHDITGTVLNGPLNPTLSLRSDFDEIVSY